MYQGPNSLTRHLRTILGRWALSFVDGGDYDRAERLLSAVAELDPRCDLPRAGAALAALLRGRHTRACDHMAELEARFPKSPLRHRISSLIQSPPGKHDRFSPTVPG